MQYCRTIEDNFCHPHERCLIQAVSNDVRLMFPAISARHVPSVVKDRKGAEAWPPQSHMQSGVDHAEISKNPQPFVTLAIQLSVLLDGSLDIGSRIPIIEYDVGNLAS